MPVWREKSAAAAVEFHLGEGEKSSNDRRL